ncbi:dynein assembly factor 3, axonemal homolog [Scaptodrosophila lebanonensis]|uniref:Dynein assembly factor 3, axonemal homolog n=1 Tax=Drosophila lebanonensis TaxID=7225 RepID=A0A6J2U1H1_DROLE|nr:dynein assembly factor 3, axonemal homolog [Scaptodrosophila lebanonensis]
MFWGLSSALDFYEEYLKAFKLQPDVADASGEQGVQIVEITDNEQSEPEVEATIPETLNILICGGADPRHVIKTMAKRYTHNYRPKLNIYLLDGCVEIAARNMLLLGVALESPEAFNLISKVHLFMDIYGNTLMRPSSHQYMAAKGRTLLKMVTDDDELQRLAPILNIEGMKYKERDSLEMAFNFWQPKPQHVFKIEEYWERRVRALLGNRYDHRQGAFDWDLSMTLKDREAQQICSQEYRYWRECGIAFVFPEYEHCKPNKTFAVGLVRNGQTYLHRGYVGDVQTGPFCAFGLRSTEERMHKSVHGDNDYRSTDVTERNLLEFFHELQTKTAYEHDESRSRRYGAVQLQMGARLIYDESDAQGLENYDKPWVDVPDVKLHFVSPEEVLQLKGGAARWRSFFDVAFVAQNYFPFLTKEFFGCLREQALFVLETKLLTVERKEQLSSYESKAKELFKQAELQPVINYQVINGHNMVLKYKKSISNN